MGKFQRYIIFLLALTVSFWVQAKPLNVVTTTGMIGDLVYNIGQDKVVLTTLMGSGVDPHLYKATHGDLRRLQQADIVFYNGLFLEGRMQDILEELSAKKSVYAVTKNIPVSELLGFDDEVYKYDPHIWFDVNLWKQAGQLVLDKLVKTDPDNSAFFKKNAKVYFAELSDLHIWVKDQIQQIPASERVLITAHDAFGYFGRAYGMEVRGLQGITTEAEFGLHDIKVLKDFIVERNIKAVFVEASVPKRFIESLVAGIQAEGRDLVIGGVLYSDAMGLKGSPTGNYIGMVKHNVNTIVGALK